MTQIHTTMSWIQASHPTTIKEEQVDYERYIPSHRTGSVNYLTLTEDLPMIVVESNQDCADTDAPMIIVANEDVTEQMIVEEEVETESDMTWYSNPPVMYEETVNTQEEKDVKPVLREGTVAVPYYQEPEDTSDIPINAQSYATYHPFPCDFCSRRFKKKANLMNHMVAHQTQRPHSCNVCTSRFMRKCDLVNHQKIHSYVPNRENRDDLHDDVRGNRPHTYVRRKNKRNKVLTKKSPARRFRDEQDRERTPESGNCLRPTSYVDEDVRLLLEMTNRLHETRRSEEGEAYQNQHEVPELATGSESKPYVCNRCGKAFAREKALVSHSQVHAEDSRYECGKCGHRFFTLELLREHSIKKHDSPYTGETSDGSDDGETKSGYRGRYTGDDRFGNFTCTVCGMRFHRQDLLKRHKREHKNDSQPTVYRCNVCHTVCSSEEKLFFHIDTNLSCQRHLCMQCGDYFNDSTMLQKHVECKHGKDLPLNACNLCGKQCKDRKSLQKHFWIHSSDKRFSCKKLDCPKKFHSWARLRRHMLSHNINKAVRCEECDEEFPDRRALINHRHSHYPESHSRRFVCHDCGKSFGSRSSQQIHNRIHTGERPYGCRYCWKAFADGGTLRKHERIHTGEKPYVCVVCPRAFNQRVVLREHIRSHHSGSIARSGYTTPVFVCSVCGVVAGSSEELAMHLVKHSDENTYKNRNPQLGMGIRSYKRRRKLNPAHRDFENEFNDEDFFEKKSTDSDDSSNDKPMPSPVRKSNRSSKRVRDYAKLTKTFEDAINNISSIVEKKPVVKKAKMINTKPKQSLKKAKKQNAPKGKVKKAVKMLTTPVLKKITRTSSGRLSGKKTLEDDLGTNVEEVASSQFDEEESRARYLGPRTKNVNYEVLESMKVEPPLATFPDKPKKAIRKPVAFQKSETNEVLLKHECFDVNNIELKSVECESYEVEQVVGNDNSTYICSVCKALFPSEADLLFHVPVHI